MKKTLFSSEIIILLLAIAVLGWLSARKFTVIRAEAASAATQEGKLMLQDAVNVYRYDHEGRCPSSLKDLIPEYLEEIPHTYQTLTRHTNSVKYGLPETDFDAKGGWIFVNKEDHPNHCQVFLNI